MFVVTDGVGRREVLRSVGAAGVGGAVIGGARLAEAEPTGHAPTRTVDVGVQYELPDGPDYFATEVDGDYLYTVEPGERVVVHRHVPDRVDDLFEQQHTVFGAVDVHAPPERISGPKVQRVPTELSRNRIVRRSVSLAEPIRPPTVVARARGPTQEPMVVVEGDRVTLSSGERRRLELDPVELTVTTRHETDEVVAVEGVPEHEWGVKTEFDSTTVQAVPTVTLKNHGKLDVAKL